MNLHLRLHTGWYSSPGVRPCLLGTPPLMLRSPLLALQQHCCCCSCCYPTLRLLAAAADPSNIPSSCREHLLSEPPAEAPHRLAQLHRGQALLVGDTPVCTACQQRPHNLHVTTHGSPVQRSVVTLPQCKEGKGKRVGRVSNWWETEQRGYSE